MINKIFLRLLCVLTIVSAGCGKSAFLDINKDPNNPADVPPKVLLPTTTYTLAFASGNELSRVASLLIQHNASSANQAVGFDIYNLDGNFDNSWNFEIYAGALPPINRLIEKTQTTGPHYAGIGKIQKAYLFSMSTDLWGDVPYSQAGNILEFPNPRFDKQEDIYQGNSGQGISSLFDMIRGGIADLEKETPDGGFEVNAEGDDLVYEGDIDRWIMMGHTLMLKLAITISKSNPTLAKSVIDEVIADGRYMTSNTDDYDIPFGTTNGSWSPYYSFNVANRNTDMMLSSRFLALMNGLNAQTYLGKLYTKPTGNFVAYDNGASSSLAAPALANRSRYSEYITGGGGTSWVRMINNANRAFILAEAALILNTAGDENDLFQEGIRASMSKAGMTDTEINTYFTANPTLVNLTGTQEEKRKQIITWKYIANVINPLEAYNDYRRTGYPQLPLALNSSGDDPTVIPKRFTYPPNETSANPSVPKPRPLTNQKVWWGQ